MTNTIELFERLKTFLAFGAEDIAQLVAIQPWVQANGPKITDTFYETLQATPEVAPFVEGRIDHLKKTHVQWMRELVGGVYDEKYFESRWRIGKAHVRIGLDPYWVEGTMSLIRGQALVRLAQTETDAQRLAAATSSLLKACDMDLAIINLAYSEDRLDRLSKFTGMKRALIENIIKLPEKS